MDTSSQIIRDLRRNYKEIKAQLDDIDDEDLGLQPYFGARFSLNLGYIVFARGRMMVLLGMEPLWADVDYERFETYAGASTVAEEGLPIYQALVDLTNAQEHLLARIKRIANADFDVTPEGHDDSLGTQLHDLVWQETYQVGQLAGLRQLASINET